jgi:hypothetical protein
VVRETAEHWLLQLQRAWASILEDGDLAWALLAQCVGALVVARMLASQPAQEAVLQGSRRWVDDCLDGARSA